MDEFTGALGDANIEVDEFPYDISIDLLEQITGFKKHDEALEKNFLNLLREY